MNADVPDVLRRYLLGDADEASAHDVERRLFSADQVFWERVSIAEDDLIDDYVAGELGEGDRKAFETRFLGTEERRAKLAFARELRAYAAEERVFAGEGIRAWLARPLAVPRWAMAAAAALVLAVVPGLLWQFGSGGQAPVAVTIAVAPGLLRDAGSEIARVTPPPGCLVMHLDLVSPADRYSHYMAALYNDNGDALWTQHRLTATSRAGANVVRLTLPCELLPEDDYWARLAGLGSGGEAVPLDRYDFRVLRD